MRAVQPADVFGFAGQVERGPGTAAGDHVESGDGELVDAFHLATGVGVAGEAVEPLEQAAAVVERHSIDDDGAVKLGALVNLKVLDLDDTTVSDATAAKVASLSKLKELYISNTKITFQGMKKLRAALPNTKIHADR